MFKISSSNFQMPPPHPPPHVPHLNTTPLISFTPLALPFLPVHTAFLLNNSFLQKQPFNKWNPLVSFAHPHPHGPPPFIWFPNLMAHGGHVLIIVVLIMSPHLINILYQTCKTFPHFSMDQQFFKNNNFLIISFCQNFFNFDKRILSGSHEQR
jgi:hypothetical protein